MIKLRFFSSFGDSDMTNHYGLSKHPDYGKKIQVVTDNTYTHAVILNIATPDIGNIPKENVIGFAFEPPAFLGLTPKFISYAIKHIGMYCIGSTDGLPLPFTERFGFLMHQTPIPRDNRKLMSIMVSDKISAPGHKYRHLLAHAILQTDLPIDIWGRGCKYYTSADNRIKGEFKDELIIHTGYKYHIAIENFQHSAYVSEKIIDSIYSGTIPIYLGGSIMDDYCIRLKGNLSEDIALLTQICSSGVEVSLKGIDDFKTEFNFGDTLLKYFGASPEPLDYSPEH